MSTKGNNGTNSITVEEKAVVMAGGYYVGQAEHAESGRWGRKHWLFSGVYSSGATLRLLRRGCPGLSQSIWVSQHENSPCFSVITIEKLEVMGLVSRDGGRAQHCHLAAQHNQGHPSPGVCLLCYSFHILIHHVSAHWSYQKFQIFKAVLSIFSIYVGIYNGLWPEKVQHLPHL